MTYERRNIPCSQHRLFNLLPLRLLISIEQIRILNCKKWQNLPQFRFKGAVSKNDHLLWIDVLQSQEVVEVHSDFRLPDKLLIGPIARAQVSLLDRGSQQY